MFLKFLLKYEKFFNGIVSFEDAENWNKHSILFRAIILAIAIAFVGALVIITSVLWIPFLIILSICIKIIRISERRNIEQVIINHCLSQELTKDGKLCFARQSNHFGELKILKHQDISTLKDVKLFIRHDFFRINREFSTVRVEPGEELYKQCRTDRRRSVGDIYCICKYYYPECTPVDVIETLTKMLNNGEIGGLFCPDVQKYVYTNRDGSFREDVRVEYSSRLLYKDVHEFYKRKLKL